MKIIRSLIPPDSGDLANLIQARSWVVVEGWANILKDKQGALCTNNIPLSIALDLEGMCDDGWEISAGQEGVVVGKHFPRRKKLSAFKTDKNSNWGWLYSYRRSYSCTTTALTRPPFLRTKQTKNNLQQQPYEAWGRFPMKWPRLLGLQSVVFGGTSFWRNGSEGEKPTTNKKLTPAVSQSILHSIELQWGGLKT